MQLSVVERLVITSMLPKSGDIGSLRLTKDLRQKLALTADEVETLVKRDNGKVTVTNVATDIALLDPEVALVAGRLEALSADRKLQPHHLDLYDKFVGE